MSKTKALQQLAIEAGLPDNIIVTYHRASRTWYIEYPLPLGTSAAAGNQSTIIANYKGLGEAKEHLAADATLFDQNYRRILGVMAGSVELLSAKEAQLLLHVNSKNGLSTSRDKDYRQLIEEGVIQVSPQPVTKEVLCRLTILGKELLSKHKTALQQLVGAGHRQQNPKVTQSYDNVTPTTDQEAIYLLLDLAEAGQPIDADLIARVRIYLHQLETDAQVKPTATGRYTSRHPDADKTTIDWQQPQQRQAPIYSHQITCQVCGQQVLVRNHSPNPPKICNDPTCRTEHNRHLARERKRRQRARQR